MRITVSEGLQTDHIEKTVGDACNLAARQTGMPWSKTDIFAHCQPGKSA